MTAAIGLLSCAVASGQSGSGDRLTASVNGSSLSDTNGGGGASLGWLHNFDSDSVMSLAMEHQTLAFARWDFLSIGGSIAGGPDNTRYGLYGEAHEGSGADPASFNYGIEALGATGTFYHKLTALVEDRQIDVETNRGNLPKVALSYLWNLNLQTSVSYQHSLSGDLGTRLTGVRLDSYEPFVNILAGTAFGQGAPVVFGYIPESGVTVNRELLPAKQLHEYYLGASKGVPAWKSDFTLVADYINLGGTKKATLTLSYIYHLSDAGP